MSRQRCISNWCLLIGVLAVGLLSCQVDENRESSREGKQYYLNGRATGLLADFTNVTCGWMPSGGGASGIEVKLRFGDNNQVGDPPRFGTFLTIFLYPPPGDRTRTAAVVSTRAVSDDSDPGGLTTFDFTAVSAEYEYGVPLEENEIIWLHKLRIPEQTFVHHRDGEITVGGSLDGLVMECDLPEFT